MEQTLFSLIMIIFLSGCASIVSKSNYPVTINSNPPDAYVIVETQEYRPVAKGKTPMTLHLKAGAGFFKKEKYIVTFSKKGYRLRTAKIINKLDNWYWGNLCFGGLVGLLIVDPATGAMWKLENLSVDLYPGY